MNAGSFLFWHVTGHDDQVDQIENPQFWGRQLSVSVISHTDSVVSDFGLKLHLTELISNLINFSVTKFVKDFL